MKTRAARARNGESGFALLLVFVMAAAIAITLYMEVPRIAFESQRTREQMTIDRGHQYVRAIQLFYRKYQTFPQTLDDLETTRNMRFLRFRYLDPLTGKPFRLLHVGPMGQLTDSLVQPATPPGGNGLNGPSSTQSGAQTASTQAPNSSQLADPNNPNDPNAQPPDPLNMANRRPSDRIIGGPGGAPGGVPGVPSGGSEPGQATLQPDPNQPGQPQQPADPNQQPAPQDPAIQQAQNPGQPPLPGQQAGGQSNSTAPVQFAPGLLQAAMGNNNGQTNANAGAGQMPGGQAGVQGQGNQQPQSAANLIQQILTTPRQPPSSVSPFTTGSTGGIAGVASTAEGKGIHVVNERTKYKEWEFYYDLKKDKTVVGAAAVNAQQQVQQQMQQSQNGANGLGSTSSSPFGSTSSPFSSTPTNSPSQATPTTPSTPSTPPPSQ